MIQRFLIWFITKFFKKTVQSIVDEKKDYFIDCLEISRSCVHPETGERFIISGGTLKDEDNPWINHSHQA